MVRPHADRCHFSTYSQGAPSIAAHSSGALREGCVAFVDLAGSERVGVSGAIHDPTRLKEAQSINLSLSTLGAFGLCFFSFADGAEPLPISLCLAGQVIRGIRNRSKHVPWRSSTLTKVLQVSFPLSVVMENVEHPYGHFKTQGIFGHDARALFICNLSPAPSSGHGMFLLLGALQY